MGIGKKPSGPTYSGVPVRRRSQPSGPWEDANGNLCASPNSYYYPAPDKKVNTDGNPNPDNWKVLKAKEHGKHLVVMMQYPDCSNYEGKKILVFENVTMVDLINQKLIDPHFFPAKSKYKSPIARFEPTDRGWLMAEEFSKLMETIGLQK